MGVAYTEEEAKAMAAEVEVRHTHTHSLSFSKVPTRHSLAPPDIFTVSVL